MADSKIYSKAPIAEALIDIRVEPAEDVTVANLDQCCTGLKGTFPGKEALNEAVGQFQLGAHISTSAQTRPVGFICATVDKKRLFQARLDGLTLNCLAPYAGWDSFRDEARMLWEAYRIAVRPPKVIRVAVRYINRLDLPVPIMDLKDYLRTVPELSPDMPQPIASFFTQMVIPQDDVKSVLILTETTTQPPGPNLSSIILDIDLSRTEDIPLTDEGMWELFELLRRRKNEVFEASITNRTRELLG